MQIPRENTTPVRRSTPSHNKKVKHIMKIEIPKETTFELPEGTYNATIINVKPSLKQIKEGPQEWVRFIWSVDVPDLSDKWNTLAGRSFCANLHPGSDLRNFLTPLLGEGYFQRRSGKSVDLTELIGTACRVELTHFFGRGYENPHVTVTMVLPPKQREAANI